MKNFSLGVIAGMTIAVFCYKPYQIEAEYQQNVIAGLRTLSPIPHCSVTIFRHDLSIEGAAVELAGEDGKRGKLAAATRQ
jgi:hypothetical protein